MKKIISLTLTVLLLLSVVNVASFSAVSATTYKDGDFSYILLDDGTAEITDYSGKETQTLEIPTMVHICAVTRIGESAFLEGAFAKVIIPQGITVVGRSAFSNCTNLAEVTIPETVTTVSASAFYNCTSLKSITVPASVTTFSCYAFGGCSNFEEIVVDENNPEYCTVDGILYDKGVTDLMFYPPKKGNEILRIPEGVTFITGAGFELCDTMKAVILPSTLKEIICDGLRFKNPQPHFYFAGTLEQYRQVIINRYDTTGPFDLHCENTTGLVVSEVVAPTCTEQGYTAYNCSDKNCAFHCNMEYKEALGHTYTTDTTLAPTCTTQGYRSRVCFTCDFEEITELKNPLGHTVVVDEAVGKTCTTSGLTEGKHCSVCEEVLTAQQVIDASHEWTDWQIVEVKQGCKDGLLARMCNVCYEMEQKAIPADIPHTEVIDEEVPPTYTETGLTEGKHCSVCNKILVEQQVVDKLQPEDDEPSFIYGDANGDGKVNINDATAIQRYIAKMITFTENQLFAADVDGNTYISINDCTTIQKQLVKLETNVQKNDVPVISGTTPEDIGTAIEYNVDKNKNDHSEHSYGYGTSGYGEYSAVISSYEEYVKLVQTPYSEYDKEFFKENSLIFLYRWTSSGSYRYSINSLSLKDKTLYMDVALNIPDGAVTDDIGNWNIYVSVNKSDVANAERLYVF